MKVAKGEYLMTVANLCVYKSKKHYNPRYIHKVKLKAEFKFQKFLPLGVPFQFTIMNYLEKFRKIKSRNTKQCAARLSRPPAKLSDGD